MPKHFNTAGPCKADIQRQDTHLDSLSEKLHEQRVQTIIEPMLAGQEIPNPPWDDIQYVLDLGICTQKQGVLEIANPIYREVLPRCLAASTTVGLGYVQPTWLWYSDDRHGIKGVESRSKRSPRSRLKTVRSVS